MKNTVFSIACLVLASLLTACGPTPLDDVDTEDYAEDYNEGVYDDYEPRRGTLQVELLISQKLNKEEQQGNASTLFTSDYNLEASLKQNVYILDDFRYFDELVGEPDSEERAAYFDTSPFWKIDDQWPEVSGLLTYEGKFRNLDPDASSFISLQKTNIGTAEPEWIRLQHLKPSIFGNGFEFDLSFQFKGTHSDATFGQYRTGAKTEDVKADATITHEEEKLRFFPALNPTRLDAFPYEYEHRDFPQYISLNQDGDQKRFESLQALFERGLDINEFIGTKVETTKEKMTITYSGSGRLLNRNFLHPIPILPNNHSIIKLTITIEAD